MPNIPQARLVKQSRKVGFFANDSLPVDPTKVTVSEAKAATDLSYYFTNESLNYDSEIEKVDDMRINLGVKLQLVGTQSYTLMMNYLYNKGDAQNNVAEDTLIQRLRGALIIRYQTFVDEEWKADDNYDYIPFECGPQIKVPATDPNTIDYIKQDNTVVGVPLENLKIVADPAP